jgi:hypothetical protein
MIPQNNRTFNQSTSREISGRPAVNGLTTKTINTNFQQQATNSSFFPTKKIKRVEKRPNRRIQAEEEEQSRPPVGKPTKVVKQESNRESIMSVDRQFVANPLSVARYCRQIFDFYIQQEVNSKDEVHHQRRRLSEDSNAAGCQREHCQSAD